MIWSTMSQATNDPKKDSLQIIYPVNVAMLIWANSTLAEWKQDTANSNAGAL